MNKSLVLKIKYDKIYFISSETEMPIFYVYMLETISKNKKRRFYTGYTNNLLRRLKEHKNGTGAKFCRGKKHITLKYFETFSERKDAMRRELEIKSLPRKEKIQLVKTFNPAENSID